VMQKKREIPIVRSKLLITPITAPYYFVSSVLLVIVVPMPCSSADFGSITRGPSDPSFASGCNHNGVIASVQRVASA
jgi:hypothetical protein